MSPSPAVHIDGVPVYGVDVDPETRCAHYATPRDVIAIRFACCGEYYPCLECHDAVTDHESERWPGESLDRRGVLCGVCGSELTISTYLACKSTCPECGTEFNPGCKNHWPMYFDVPRES